MACFRHAIVRDVSALQVKNVPEELHDELRRRAAETGKTVGEIVLDAIRRELRTETVREWAERVSNIPLTGPRPTRAQIRAAHQAAKRDQR